MPTINLKETGKHIKELTKDNGYTAKDIQNTFGFATPYSVYKWFNGQGLPTVDNLVALAKILNTTIDELLITE